MILNLNFFCIAFFYCTTFLAMEYPNTPPRKKFKTHPDNTITVHESYSKKSISKLIDSSRVLKSHLKSTSDDAQLSKQIKSYDIQKLAKYIPDATERELILNLSAYFSKNHAQECHEIESKLLYHSIPELVTLANVSDKFDIPKLYCRAISYLAFNIKMNLLTSNLRENIIALSTVNRPIKSELLLSLMKLTSKVFTINGKNHKLAAFSPDNRCLAIASTDQNTVTIVDLTNNAELKSFQIKDPITALKFIPKNGKSTLIIGSYSGELLKYKIQKGLIQKILLNPYTIAEANSINSIKSQHEMLITHQNNQIGSSVSHIIDVKTFTVCEREYDTFLNATQEMNQYCPTKRIDSSDNSFSLILKFLHDENKKKDYYLSTLINNKTQASEDFCMHHEYNAEFSSDNKYLAVPTSSGTDIYRIKFSFEEALALALVKQHKEYKEELKIDEVTKPLFSSFTHAEKKGFASEFDIIIK